MAPAQPAPARNASSDRREGMPDTAIQERAGEERAGFAFRPTHMQASIFSHASPVSAVERRALFWFKMHVDLAEDTNIKQQQN